MTDLRTLLVSSGVAALAVLFGLALHAVGASIAARLHTRRPFTVRGIALRLTYWHGPLRALIPALVLAAVLPFLRFPPEVYTAVGHALGLWIIGALAWFLIRTFAMAREMILSHYHMNVKDNLRARRVYTQLRLIERVLIVLCLVFTVAIMLMTFDEVRQIGVSLLASAGVIGIIAGFAAQRSLGALFAGFQIAVSQPIRIDDVVIVEGEWGSIEDITLTYAVVRIWDERRLVVPITYFLEKPFQNWTRTTAQLFGTVFIHADYSLPVQTVREELRRILDATPLWDRRAWGLQVTDATEHTIELRALMSAVDSSTVWDLRCHVREKLLEFMQTHFPDRLPRVRVHLDGDAGRCLPPGDAGPLQGRRRAQEAGQPTGPASPASGAG